MPNPSFQNNRRWLEIRFYLFCRNISAKTQSLNCINQLISGANYNKTYDETLLHDFITDVFVFKRNTPHILELIILNDAFPERLRIKQIKALTKASDEEINKAIYCLRKEQLSLKSLTPKYPKEVQQAIIAFFYSLQNLNKNITRCRNEH